MARRYPIKNLDDTLMSESELFGEETSANAEHNNDAGAGNMESPVGAPAPDAPGPAEQPAADPAVQARADHNAGSLGMIIHYDDLSADGCRALKARFMGMNAKALHTMASLAGPLATVMDRFSNEAHWIHRNKDLSVYRPNNRFWDVLNESLHEVLEHERANVARNSGAMHSDSFMGAQGTPADGQQLAWKPSPPARGEETVQSQPSRYINERQLAANKAIDDKLHSGRARKA